jgi:hypothetical protein
MTAGAVRRWLALGGVLVDDGTAAILGAAVGVAGTIVAAALAVASARWQVRTQAVTEDARWRARQRRDAYAGLLTSVRRAVGSLASAGEALSADSPDVSEGTRLLAHAWSTLGDLEAALATVQLEGPESVIEAASAMTEAIFAVFGTTTRWRGADGLAAASDRSWDAWKIARGELDVRMKVFLATAATVVRES